MEILELAAQLGMKIKEDAKVQAYYVANEAYENDEALQELVSEYNVQRMAMEEELEKDEPDSGFVEIIEGRLQEIYDEVVKNPIFLTYQEATQTLNKIMQMVTSEIRFQVTGDRPCSHDDCSECSGCH